MSHLKDDAAPAGREFWPAVQGEFGGHASSVKVDIPVDADEAGEKPAEG